MLDRARIISSGGCLIVVPPPAATERSAQLRPDQRAIVEPGDGPWVSVVTGSIDRIDRLPSGGIEVIDYKTGKVSSQKGVDESLQLSIYALACRDALGLGTPERVTLYFTETATRLSTTRTGAQLDAARANILARTRPSPLRRLRGHPSQPRPAD